MDFNIFPCPPMSKSSTSGHVSKVAVGPSKCFGRPGRTIEHTVIMADYTVDYTVDYIISPITFVFLISFISLILFLLSFT